VWYYAAGFATTISTEFPEKDQKFCRLYLIRVHPAVLATPDFTVLYNLRINHQLIFAAIPEYSNVAKPVFVDAEIPEYSNVAESERKNGEPFVVHNEQLHRFGVLEIPKKILDNYRMMDQEQIQKETPVNFSVNSNDIKSVSYTLISTTSSVCFDPLLMTTFVPGNLSIEFGYNVSMVTGRETIAFIIRYEENVLDRLALLLGKTLVKSLK
jgi:hypothetical protein